MGRSDPRDPSDQLGRWDQLHLRPLRRLRQQDQWDPSRPWHLSLRPNQPDLEDQLRRWDQPNLEDQWGRQRLRQLHRERGTSLIETTSHQIRSGEVFDHLTHELTLRGIVLNPNPDREIPEGGQKPMEPAELIGLVRTFISHTKSNCLTIPALQTTPLSPPGPA